MTHKFKNSLERFLRDESGLSAVEYGLLAAGIVVGLYAVIGDIGTSLHDIYVSVKNDMNPTPG